MIKICIRQNSITEETNRITNKDSEQQTGESLLFGNNEDPGFILDESIRNNRIKSGLNDHHIFSDNNRNVREFLV